MKGPFVAAALAIPSVMLLQSGASAVITQADFSEVLAIPGFGVEPRIEFNGGVGLPSAGPQLTGANVISNPSGLGGSLDVSFDAGTDVLTLTADAFETYTTITVSLNSVLFDNGDVITGITPISTGNAVVPDISPVSITEAFTRNSFQVSYVAGSGIFPDQFLLALGGGDSPPVVKDIAGR